MGIERGKIWRPEPLFWETISLKKKERTVSHTFYRSKGGKKEKGDS